MSRLRVYKISQRHIMALLANGSHLPDVVEIPTCSSIPEGAKIHHLFLSYGGMSVGIVVEHESFDLVPDGKDPPDADPEMMISAYRVYGEYGLIPTDKEELKSLLKAVQTELEKPE